ncbi:MAG: ribbon-helix-helix domain-containing protein [Candidatus Thermoplasmatota archaeon]
MSIETETEKITLRVPKRYLAMIDYLVEMDDFSSRSEAIRTAMRDMLYARVDLVQEKIQRMQKAEQAIAQMDELRKEYLRR